ncbi:MAG: redoxin domain-containing protein [Pyrinomonadaceae bacterium]
MKRVVLIFGLLIAAVVASSAQNLAIGSTMQNFSLADTSGKTQTLDGLKGKNGAVVVFLSSQCPVVRAYNERINQIASDYAAKGISFIGINSNVSEAPDAIKTHAELNYHFPVLLDKNSVLADKLGASVTPEVYYIDAKNVLLYHGAIDNDRSGRSITDPYLRTAFDASLAGKKIERATASAFGCSIKRNSD